jgi:hypothetical protein
MRKPAIVLALSFVGCAHSPARFDSSVSELTSTEIEATRVVRGNPQRADGTVNPIDVVWVADVNAVEEATATPGLGLLCGDADVDPTHVCPGTTPGPSSPPPDSSGPPPPPN